MVEVSGEMAIAALQKLEASFGFRIYRKANVSIGRHQQLGLPSNLYIAWQRLREAKRLLLKSFCCLAWDVFPCDLKSFFIGLPLFYLGGLN